MAVARREFLKWLGLAPVAAAATLVGYRAASAPKAYKSFGFGFRVHKDSVDDFTKDWGHYQTKPGATPVQFAGATSGPVERFESIEAMRRHDEAQGWRGRFGHGHAR